MDNQFKTDPTKVKTPLLWPLEQKWIAKVVPRLPKFLNGVSLTLFNIVWSVLVIIAGWLAISNINWLWGISVIILLHYLCDALDGAVGRYRKSGLVNWGHLMDHFLDFIFLCAIIVAYALILPNSNIILLIILATFGGLMVITYIMSGITKQFRMSYFRIGATEVMIGIIILNALTIFIGAQLLYRVFIALDIILFTTLIYATYKAQRQAWRIDQDNKKIS